MVKTRHSGGPDESTFGAFVTLSPRRTRTHPTYVEETRKASDPEAKKPKELSSDEFEESVHAPARYRSRRREQLLVEADESLSADDTVFKHRDTRSQHVRRSNRRHVYKDDNNPYAKPRYDASSPPRSARSIRTRGLQPEKDISPELLNGEGEGTRRSTRQKKLMYNTYNMNVIDKQLTMLEGIEDTPDDGDTVKSQPYTKRRKLEVIESVPEEEKNGDETGEPQMVDMYTRVKRERRCVKRNMYGMPIQDGAEKSTEESNEEEEVEAEEEAENESSSSSEEEEEEQGPGKYFLRVHKPRTALYEAPSIEPKARAPRSCFYRDTSPPRHKKTQGKATYRSPAHRKVNFNHSRKKRAFHGDSSTSSSSSSDDGDGSGDERRFEKRKAKSMARSRQRCLPMNLDKDDVAQGVIRDRQKIGSSLADIDPMAVDKSVTFEQVGGLGKHVRSLKEMILFPLMYPEVFERFKITPPRGVLFYGPPGTGKTLIARALANECSDGNRKVAFFMRKGADCLSKWVGESERQLRLLFDQAFQVRPSIIFFDEIDGLAPVRSSRQDQIHSSIVSTLLALMDGLDSRGEVVVIGATNRIDSIDPALRRPGRFDREFLFPLPSKEARQQILRIQTSAWTPKLSEPFLCDLSQQCVGYCGADLKALCTEAALQALRRRYPQIYTSQDKLQLDVTKINVSSRDFHHGMQNIVPASQRAVSCPGRGLSNSVKPLMQQIFKHALDVLSKVFPQTAEPSTASKTDGDDNQAELDLYSDDDDDTPEIYDSVQGRNRSVSSSDDKRFFEFSGMGFRGPATHRPRLLLEGQVGQGQSTHLAPALLHNLERLPVHTLDLPTLFGVSVRTPEESCSQIFREARRTSPSVIYMPHLDQWWEVITDTLRATFVTLLHDVEPNTPVFLLATSEEAYTALPFEVRAIFDRHASEVFSMRDPTFAERKDYFNYLYLTQAVKAPSSKKVAATRLLEVLPTAPAPAPRELTQAEMKKLLDQEENTLRELRLFLREILNKLGRDRKFSIFAKPVDQEEVPDYYEVIACPMDLSTMMSKIDLHKYTSVTEFLADIDLICSNALEYNPDRDPQDRAIRHRACELRDASRALMNAELDPDFEKTCHEIMESRERRGASSSVTVPSYYYARPADKYQPGVRKEILDNSGSNYPSRYSRRARGMPAEEDKEAGQEEADEPAQTEQQEEKPQYRIVVKKVPAKRTHAPLPPFKARSPWLKPRRRKYIKMYYYVDEFGNQFPADDLNKSASQAEDGNPDKSKSMETEPDVKDNGEEEKTDDARDDESETSKVKTEDEADAKDDDKKPSEKLTNGIVDSDEEETENGWHPTTPAVKSSPTVQSRSSRHNSPRSTRASTSSPGRSAVTSPSSTTPARHTSPRSHHNSPSSPRPSTSGISPSRMGKSSMCNGTSPEKSQGTTTNSAQNKESQETSTSPRSAKKTKNKQNEIEAMEICPSTSPSVSLPDTACTDDKTENNDDEIEKDVTESKDEKSEMPQRITRSQVNSAQACQAKKILSEVVPNLVVDKAALEQLLTVTVERTAGYRIEKLERLYSILSQCIYTHRKAYDKTDLIKEMETIVDSYTKSKG